MFHVLPDSKGCIKKILYHHSPIRRSGNLVREGLFKNFLEKLNETGIQPDVFCISTHEDEEEKEFLRKEAETWSSLTASLNYIEVEVKRGFLSKPPYAQDVCTVISSPEASAIMAKSDRCAKFPNFMSEAEELINIAGLDIVRLNSDYNLEGGYLQSTSGCIFYSDPNDKEVVKHFEQKSFFIEDIINNLLKKMFRIFFISSYTVAELPAHVDLMFSFIERENSYDVFYVDFRENTLMNPFLSYDQYQSLTTVFDKWDTKINKICKKIERCLKNARFHKMPGVLDFEQISASKNGVPGTAVLPYLYSGVNLLFHSAQNKDYSFYLKYPKENEELKGLEFNKEIEKILKGAGVSAVPISGDDESINFIHIINSAGIRCLIKVLSRLQH